jgi:3-oxoacyl-[acyl-carrier protein] reductase
LPDVDRLKQGWSAEVEAINSLKVVLVTGASGSIGREIAALAAASGWAVVVHGRSRDSAGHAARTLAARFPIARIFPVGCDLLEPGASSAMIEAIDREFGRLDAVINCAVSAPSGISGRFVDTDPQHYTDLCHHAITQLQWLCHAAFPLMTRGGGGAVVAMASDAGSFAAPNQSLIGPTRAAIMNFCRNVALEVARDNIRVNCLSSSYVEETATFQKMIDAGSKRAETARKRAGLGLPVPADIAKLSLFLIGADSTRLTGQVISLNGGLNA